MIIHDGVCSFMLTANTVGIFAIISPVFRHPVIDIVSKFGNISVFLPITADKTSGTAAALATATAVAESARCYDATDDQDNANDYEDCFWFHFFALFLLFC